MAKKAQDEQQELTEGQLELLSEDANEGKPAVVYVGPYDVRVLSPKDLDALGITSDEEFIWSRGNGRRVHTTKTNAKLLAEALPNEFVAV